MPVEAEIPVSNPCRGTVSSCVSDPELGPASTRQDDTVVAPFQLAHTSLVVSLLAPAAMLGGVVGCPVHWKRYAR